MRSPLQVFKPWAYALIAVIGLGEIEYRVSMAVGKFASHQLLSWDMALLLGVMIMVGVSSGRCVLRSVPGGRVLLTLVVLSLPTYLVVTAVRIGHFHSILWAYSPWSGLLLAAIVALTGGFGLIIGRHRRIDGAVGIIQSSSVVASGAATLIWIAGVGAIYAHDARLLGAAAPPNLSLKRSPAGMAPGPQSGSAIVASCGPGAMPASLA